MTFETHEAYFATLAAPLRARLEAIQARVEALRPRAQRCISYGLPAFRDGRVFLYFAAFQRHIGLYPPVSALDTADADLVAALAPYRGPKGNLRFPHDQPLPMPLIERVVCALHRQYAGPGR